MAARKQAPKVQFSQELFDRICGLIAEGASLRAACIGEGMPTRQTFNEWRKRAPELQAQYDSACIDREEVYFEEIIEIADDGTNDTIPRVGRDGREFGEQPDSEWIARSRLRVDARKWVLARMNRKKYGDHVTEELTGPNGGPLQVERVRLNMQPVEELPE